MDESTKAYLRMNAYLRLKLAANPTIDFATLKHDCIYDGFDPGDMPYIMEYFLAPNAKDGRAAS